MSSKIATSFGPPHSKGGIPGTSLKNDCVGITSCPKTQSSAFLSLLHGSRRYSYVVVSVEFVGKDVSGNGSGRY